ncbi:MAG: hypothetical protein K0B07_04905 [DPANN group archaeon]|nr:hypothetical protein [DPANN group archaeon]
MKLLFICQGNSERSVIAQELYNKHSNSTDSQSAGLNVSDLPRTELMFKLMKSENIDITDKPKTQLTEDMLTKVDKVIVLCSKDKCPNYLLNSEKVSFWDIPNPWNQNYEFLLQTKKLIKEHLNSLL